MIGEDLTLFFNTAEFATTATVGSTSIKGILDQEFLAMGMGAEGRSIVFCCPTSETTGLHHGDTVTIGTADYKIVGIEPHGDGAITDLILSL